jgi:hypothetical protein
MIGMTPWFTGEMGNQAVVLNSALVGVVVLGLAAFEFVDLRRGEEVAEFACGTWLWVHPSSLAMPVLAS